MSREVAVVENVLRVNDELAKMLRQTLSSKRIFTVNLIGAPGCGKTALLEKTLEKLASELRLAVMVGDLTTARDAQRMSPWCDQVVQINTGKGCHLEANHVLQAMSRIDLSRVDLLFIENVGNLICPVGFDLGQDVKVGMFSVTEGDDKPAKHPYIVAEASALILNKTDLMPYVPFRKQVFDEDIRRLNAKAPLFELSVVKGDGIDSWIEWLRAGVRRKRA
jgi:hydrogenase nickel incorporation protein HypB